MLYPLGVILRKLLRSADAESPGVYS